MNNDEWKLELRLIVVFCAVLLLGVLYFYGVGRIRFEEQQKTALINSLPNAFSEYIPSSKAIFVYAPTSDHILYAHHEYTTLPLASLTKIMTTTVALEKMDPVQNILIDEESRNTYGDNGLAINEVWPLFDLIKFMMFVSSNDAANAIASSYDTLQVANDPINHSTFVTTMNEYARTMNLPSLTFKNSSGLDMVNESGGNGDARDIAILYYKLYIEHPEIVKNSAVFKQSYTSIDGITHAVTNTNILLENDFDRIIGSKTGFTNKAGGNLIVLLDTPLQEPIVLVVLGSTEKGRFEEMSKLLSETRLFTNSLYQKGLTFSDLK